MATVKTNIYDSKNKKNLTGYIKEGKTYTDDGKRISEGMQVQVSNGDTYEMQSDGSSKKIGSITPNPERQTSTQRRVSSGQESMASEIQKAFEAKNKALQDGLNTQLGEIKQSSDDNRSNVYVNSRLSAIGNNEQLASQGLAGELYGSPMSGKSESSRINENVALGNNINAVNRQQTSLENQAKNTIGSQIADNQLQMAQTIAQLRQQERESQKAEYASTIGAYAGDYQQEINRLKAMGYTDDDYEIKVLNQAREQKKSGIAQSQAEAEQQAFENQLKLMETQYKVGKPYYKPSSGGTGSSDTAKSLLSATEVKGLVAKDEDGKVDEKATLSNLLKQKNIGNLSEADYAKYVGLYVPSKKIGGTSFDGAKVQQLVNGLGTYMLTGGSKNAVLTQIENLYWSGDLSQTEANAILQQFGISGI